MALKTSSSPHGLTMMIVRVTQGSPHGHHLGRGTRENRQTTEACTVTHTLHRLGFLRGGTLDEVFICDPADAVPWSDSLRLQSPTNY